MSLIKKFKNVIARFGKKKQPESAARHCEYLNHYFQPVPTCVQTRQRVHHRPAGRSYPPTRDLAHSKKLIMFRVTRANGFVANKDGYIGDCKFLKKIEEVDLASASGLKRHKTNRRKNESS